MDRPVVFLSDYGLDDEFVGVCRAVVGTIAPGTTVIDLSHAIPPQDVLRGALVLAQSMPYLPRGAVLMAVVDPGVGTERRPIAVETRHGSHLMVGPDNGVLSLAWAEVGGVERCAEIRSPEVVLEPISATFHGRDVFAPAAARLSSGMDLGHVGPAVDPGTLITVQVPSPGVEPGRIACEVLAVDRFGNVQLSVRTEHLAQAGLATEEWLEVESGGSRSQVRRAAVFADVAEGQLAALIDSAGWLALVINRGSAAESLGLIPGSPVSLA